MNIFFRVPAQEKILFAKNLAVMTKAGMPILDCLKLLQKQVKSKSMKKILNQFIEDVSNGQFLSASLEKFKNIFGNFAVNIIRVGEASGILYENLNYLAEELAKKQALRRKVLGALIYPAIVVLATVAITGILIIYVFPKIIPVFKSLKIVLPFSTKILIALSEFLFAYGAYVAAGVVVLIIAGWLLTRVRLVRFLMHRSLLCLPVAGSLSQNYNIANFCRTLGLLLKSDIKVVEAINITGDTLNNLVYKKEFANMAQEISRGEEISKHLEEKPHLFPPMLAQLTAIGETTGNLSETLLYLSGFYEEKFEDATKNLSTVLEPLMMLIMGAIVGFIAISIITPIYEITQGLKM